MRIWQRVNLFVVYAVVCCLVAELFYDRYWLFVLALPFSFVYLRSREGRQKKGKELVLIRQFVSLLEFMSGSLLAGKSLQHAFEVAAQQWSEYATSQHREMQVSIQQVLLRLKNGYSIEQSLLLSAEMMGVQRIMDCIQVICIVQRKNGDLIQTVRQLIEILQETELLQGEIDRMIAQKKYEANIIMVIPFLLLGVLKWSSPNYLSLLYQFPSGVILMSIMLILLLLSCYWIQQIVAVKL